MHSLWSRGNAVLTTASTLLFIICAATSITDLFFEAKGVDINVETTKVERLKLDSRTRNDHASLTIKLEADLRGAFSWNTKQLFLFVQAEYETPANRLNQVFLWDAILEDKAAAVIKKRLRQEYVFDDDGRNLRDRRFNITVGWNVMPKVGYLVTHTRTFSNFQMPETYS